MWRCARHLPLRGGPVAVVHLVLLAQRTMRYDDSGSSRPQQGIL
jgi:hypothetical protein